MKRVFEACFTAYKYSRDLTTLRKKPFEKVGKEENAGNQHFLLFLQCFLPYQRQISSYNPFNLLTGNAFNLEQSEICSSIKVLWLLFPRPNFQTSSKKLNLSRNPIHKIAAIVDSNLSTKVCIYRLLNVLGILRYIVAFVEDNANMSSMWYFENHVSYFVQNRTKQTLSNSFLDGEQVFR